MDTALVSSMGVWFPTHKISANAVHAIQGLQELQIINVPVQKERKSTATTLARSVRCPAARNATLNSPMSAMNAKGSLFWEMASVTVKMLGLLRMKMGSVVNATCKNVYPVLPQIHSNVWFQLQL